MEVLFGRSMLEPDLLAASNWLASLTRTGRRLALDCPVGVDVSLALHAGDTLLPGPRAVFHIVRV